MALFYLEDEPSMRANLKIIKPDFINAWWSRDKEGKNKLTKAYLEETAFFHVETKGIKEGTELKLKLFDYDRFIFNDWINPDDDEFPDKEIIKTAVVKSVNGRYIATVELMLDLSWETMIEEDSGPFKQIDLYWEVSCEQMFFSYNLPKFQQDFLSVRYSKRDLYVKPSEPGSQVPELVSIKGGLIMLFSTSFAVSKDSIADYFKALGNKLTSKVALGKLEKGYLVTNKGEVFVLPQRVKTMDVHTNEGKLLKDIKQARNFGNGAYTTKGISQYDYFAKNGVRVNLLGFLRNIGDIFNIIDIATFAKSISDNGLDTSKPMPIPMYLLEPINIMAGIVVSDMVDDINQMLEEEFQKELAIAKSEGLDAVKKLVSYNSYGYTIEPIQKETAQKLLKGQFSAYNELSEFDSISKENEEVVNLLIRNTKHPINKKDISIVESIFINE